MWSKNFLKTFCFAEITKPETRETGEDQRADYVEARQRQEARPTSKVKQRRVK